MFSSTSHDYVTANRLVMHKLGDLRHFLRLVIKTLYGYFMVKGSLDTFPSTNTTSHTFLAIKHFYQYSYPGNIYNKYNSLVSFKSLTTPS